MNETVKWYYASPDAISATYKLQVAFLGVTVRTLCDKHGDRYIIEGKIGQLVPREVLKFFCLDSFKTQCEACDNKTFQTINEIPKHITQGLSSN